MSVSEDDIKQEVDAASAPAPAPVTPRKRGRKPKAKKEEGEESDSDDNGQTSSPTKKADKGSPSKRSRGLGPIPASYEEAGEADRLLLKMKDEEGKPWAVITEVLEGIAGCKLAGLSTRYSRIKANFVVFPKEDETLLLQSKKDIETKFEVEKWQRIASDVEAKSGHKYSVTALQKKFKELSKTTTGPALGE